MQEINTELDKLFATAPPPALEQLLEKPAPKAPEPPEDQTQNVFGFCYLAYSTDKAGVPKARPEYVKRSCNTCYGRGYQIETKFGRGRSYIACRCVENGYARAAKEFAKALQIAVLASTMPEAEGGEPIALTPEAEVTLRKQVLAAFFP